MPDFILTSGNFVKNEFSKKLSNNTRIINVGSNKFFKKNCFRKNENVLFIPEGFKSETLKMFKFASKAANKFKDKNFFLDFIP